MSLYITQAVGNSSEKIQSLPKSQADPQSKPEATGVSQVFQRTISDLSCQQSEKPLEKLAQREITPQNVGNRNRLIRCILTWDAKNAKTTPDLSSLIGSLTVQEIAEVIPSTWPGKEMAGSLFEMLQLLDENGAKLNQKDAYGHTPFENFIAHPIRFDHLLKEGEFNDIIAFFIEKDPDTFAKIKDSISRIAVQRGDPKLLQSFLDKGTKPENYYNDKSFIQEMLPVLRKPRRDPSQLIKMLVCQEGVRCSLEDVCIMLKIASLKGLQEFLPHVQIDTMEVLPLFLATLNRKDSIEILQLLEKQGLQLTRDLLYVAICENRGSVVGWLIGKGIEATEKEIEAAFYSGNLEICLHFKEVKEIAKLIFKGNFDLLLNHFYMHSDVENFKKLLLWVTPVITKDVEEELRSMALAARFIHPDDKEEILIHYTDSKGENKRYDAKQNLSYTQKQRDYAKSCRKAVLEMQASHPKTLREQFAFFSKKRAELAEERGDSRVEDYTRIRGGAADKHVFYDTLIGDLVEKYRYNFILEPFVFEILASSPPGVQFNNEGGYDLLYPDPETGENIVLTSVLQNRDAGWRWIHTSVSDMEKLWPHLESLCAEIKAMAVDPEHPAEFFNKVAKAFWLGSHVMRTRRGNAQNCLNWLYGTCLEHGLSPLLPKREYPQTDCIALSVPLDQFVRDFRGYFEEEITIY